MQSMTKAAMGRNVQNMTEEFCKACNIPVPAPGSSEARLCVQNASGYMASLVLGIAAALGQ